MPREGDTIYQLDTNVDPVSHARGSVAVFDRIFIYTELWASVNNERNVCLSGFMYCN